MILVLVFDEWWHFHEYSCGSIAYLTVRSSPTCNFWSCLHLHFYSFQCYRGTLHHRWSLPGYLGSLQWSSEQLFATSSCGGSTKYQPPRQEVPSVAPLIPRPWRGRWIGSIVFPRTAASNLFHSILSLIHFLPRVVLFKVSRFKKACYYHFKHLK